MVAKKTKITDDFEEVQIGPDEPVYTTGVVCRVLEIPVWVLKQLDAEEIVSPPRRSENASRLYSKRELQKVKHCWFYIKEHKVNISGLRIILTMEKSKY
ncbi:MAG: hypothetical protein A2Y06_02135 [Omnitrophica WOR_2 bacterium GWA2_37_7]|nr:MAG: hypothetical protein A2Y06_02135 [Omnitrophica WOR_2 bacterium GWA2_37_7]